MFAYPFWKSMCGNDGQSPQPHVHRIHLHTKRQPSTTHTRPRHLRDLTQWKNISVQIRNREYDNES